MSERLAFDVELRRAPPKGQNQHGSFGFSIMGGAGYKLPAVICEMDETGPAALAGQVNQTTCRSASVYVLLKWVLAKPLKNLYL